jgi:hypothetical protein
MESEKSSVGKTEPICLATRGYFGAASGLRVLTHLVRTEQIRQREIEFVATYFGDLIDALLGSRSLQLLLMIILSSVIAWSAHHG